MSARVFLEEFGAVDARVSSDLRGNEHSSDTDQTAADLESKRLEGYAAGYQAGWDDASKANADEKERVEAEFARNLQDLGFTFQEARSHVLGTLEPLLTAMVEAVLPKAIQEALGQVINEELIPMAEQAADSPIQVLVSPASRGALDHLMQHPNAVPFEIVEEGTLPEGQVYLRSPTAERRIDLSSALDRIKDAVEAVYDINEKAFNYG